MIINILIPDCTRSEHNVFFSILKNVVFRVGHAKLTEHFLDNAFKDGMKAREFQVDLHTAATWNIDSSRRDKILLSKLLGCWASRNCQTFGRILYKEKWETTDSRSVLANNIDKFVYKTLKCILIELDVSESTLTNLKHFVKVPVNEIGLENMVQISPKMKVYQIKNIHWEKCWMSLSRGEWLGSSHGEINNSIPFPSLNTPTQALINSECATTHSSGNSTPLNFSRKRAYGIGIHSQSAMPSMVFECNNTPVNLTSYQSQRNDIRSNGQAQSQPSRSSEPSMSAECNNVTPLDLTSKQSHDNNMRMNVNSATTTVIQTTDKELQQRVNLLQDQLLSALQRELDQKNVQLDERNESIAEAQKSIVFLQLQLIDKNSSNNDLRQQLEQQLAAHIESTGKLQDLNDALTKKEESFTETESALRSEIKAKNEILVQLRQENQKLHLKLSEHSETTSATISAQRSEIAATNELLSQTQESKDLLQQQLDAHIESTGKLQDLNDELTKKKESFTETESALRSEIKAKNETLVQLRQENRNLHLRFSEQSESTSAIISAQRSEIAATNELLSQTQVSKDLLQQQLITRNESVDELSESVKTLQLQLTTKDKSMNEIGNLQYEIQETIKYLESEIITQKLSLGESEKVNQSLRAEMTQKDSSINELQQLVATLKLQLDQKIPHEIVPALSEEATKMSVERVEQTLQPEQQCPPGTLPIVSGIDRHNSRGKIKDQNSRVIVQANVTTRTSSRMRRSKYSKQMSRPRFVQPPDVDDMTRAEEVESEHPSDDK